MQELLSAGHELGPTLRDENLQTEAEELIAAQEHLRQVQADRPWAEGVPSRSRCMSELCLCPRLGQR